MDRTLEVDEQVVGIYALPAGSEERSSEVAIFRRQNTDLFQEFAHEICRRHGLPDTAVSYVSAVVAEVASGRLFDSSSPHSTAGASWLHRLFNDSMEHLRPDRSARGSKTVVRKMMGRIVVPNDTEFEATMEVLRAALARDDSHFLACLATLTLQGAIQSTALMVVAIETLLRDFAGVSKVSTGRVVRPRQAEAMARLLANDDDWGLPADESTDVLLLIAARRDAYPVFEEAGCDVPIRVIRSIAYLTMEVFEANWHAKASSRTDDLETLMFRVRVANEQAAANH